MPRLRPLLAGTVLVLLACLGSGTAAAATGRAAADEELATAAGAFVDSVGVNVHPGDARTGWALAERLQAAGIHHARGPAATGPDDPALPGLRALAGAGLQLDLAVGAGTDPAAAVAAAASLGPAVVALEAPADETATPLRRAVLAHPRLLPGVAVLGSGPGADHQAVRLDLAGRCPGCVADELGSGDAAVQVTEVDLGAGVPDAVAARYLPRLLLADAGLAVRTYVAGEGGDAGPGLLGPGGSPTPAYATVARMLALLDDGRRQVAPDRLGFRLTGDTDAVRHRLLQKADGHFWLALWVEEPGWDPASGRELAVPTRRLRVVLDTPVAGARAFVPELGTSPQRGFADPPGAGRPLDRIDLEVTDRVLLLELLPRRADGAAPRATAPPTEPAPATPAAQEPQVAGSSQTAAPTSTAAAAPDATRVAAAGEPAATADPASRPPLAFTGSAALSMLVASVLLMGVGWAALFASRRRYHHRH
jgi:hypothetical protein